MVHYVCVTSNRNVSPKNRKKLKYYYGFICLGMGEKDTMKLCIIVGTRPEVIKMSPVIKECEKRNLEYFILHTGQHYSYELDKLFLKS